MIKSVWASIECEREWFDAMVAAVRRYPRTIAGTTNSDQAWDEVLAASDGLCEHRYVKHLN
jgi:hypothetical protein